MGGSSQPNSTDHHRAAYSHFSFSETISPSTSLYEISEVAAYLKGPGASKLGDTAALRVWLVGSGPCKSLRLSGQRRQMRTESKYATSELGVGFGRYRRQGRRTPSRPCHGERIARIGRTCPRRRGPGRKPRGLRGIGSPI